MSKKGSNLQRQATGAAGLSGRFPVAPLPASPASLKKMRRRREAVADLQAAPRGSRSRLARRWAQRLRIKAKTVYNLLYIFLRDGEHGLLDKRPSALWRSGNARILSPSAIHQLQSMAAQSRQSNQAVIREFQRHHSGPGTSAGNLARYLKPRVSPGRVVLFRATIEARADGTWRVTHLRRNPCK